MAGRERIDLENVSKKEPLNFPFDVIEWKKNKYKKPLKDFKIANREINFKVDDARVKQISGLKKRFSSYNTEELIYQAVQFTTPKYLLLHILEYGK